MNPVTKKRQARIARKQEEVARLEAILRKGILWLSTHKYTNDEYVDKVLADAKVYFEEKRDA